MNDSTNHPIRDLQSALSKHLIGHELLIERLVIALLSNGHCLIEGPPGIAKTKAVNTFSQLLDLNFARVQATPDLLPADLTGTDVYRSDTGTFEFISGPLFNQVVLVDEINRAMAEQQITTGNTTRELQTPFLVAATQNPIEHEGTYPLPEAQLDRFMFHLELSLPGVEQERRILDHLIDDHSSDSQTLQSLADGESIKQAMNECESIHVSPAVRDYIVRLTTATRGGAAYDIAHAASPRGSIYLAQAARAKAWLKGRDHVQPDDVMELAPDVLSGRISLTYRARADGKTGRSIVQSIIDDTPVV